MQPDICTDSDTCTANYGGNAYGGCECPKEKPLCSNSGGSWRCAPQLVRHAGLKSPFCGEQGGCHSRSNCIALNCTEKHMQGGRQLSTKQCLHVQSCNVAIQNCKNPGACRCPDPYPNCAILSSTVSRCQARPPGTQVPSISRTEWGKQNEMHWHDFGVRNYCFTILYCSPLSVPMPRFALRAVVPTPPVVSALKQNHDARPS